MAFCQNCGQQLDDGSNVCPKCGTAQSASVVNSDASSNKLMGILAYLSWLVLIPLFCAKESKFARFHTKQGLLLALCELVVGVCGSILTSVFGLIPVVGVIVGLLIGIITGILNIVFFVLAVIGIINVCKGEAKELPIIGKIHILDQYIK